LKPAYDEEPGIQSKVTEWLTGAAPDPESDTASGELAALLMMLTLPEKLPLVVGANFALREAACPAASVRGTANAVPLNPVPLTLICEMDTLELPVFVRVTLCVALVLVVMLPKLTEVGDGVSWRTVEAPVPARETISGELGVLFTSVRLPEKLLPEGGLKPTVNVEDPPGATESGNDRPEKL